MSASRKKRHTPPVRRPAGHSNGSTRPRTKRHSLGAAALAPRRTHAQSTRTRRHDARYRQAITLAVLGGLASGTASVFWPTIISLLSR